MKLTIIRHGQTNYNILGLHNANPNVDVHLTEKGIAEAKSLAEKLQHEPFDSIFVSTLPRTAQTASYINSFHHLPIIADARLNDIQTGFEGKSVNEYHTIRDQTPDRFTFSYQNNESPKDVYLRTTDFLNFLRTQSFKNVLIITSKHNFRHFRSLLNHTDPRQSLQEDIPNGEIFTHEL